MRGAHQKPTDRNINWKAACLRLMCRHRTEAKYREENPEAVTGALLRAKERQTVLGVVRVKFHSKTDHSAKRGSAQSTLEALDARHVPTRRRDAFNLSGDRIRANSAGR